MSNDFYIGNIKQECGRYGHDLMILCYNLFKKNCTGNRTTCTNSIATAL